MQPWWAPNGTADRFVRTGLIFDSAPGNHGGPEPMRVSLFNVILPPTNNNNTQPCTSQSGQGLNVSWAWHLCARTHTQCAAPADLPWQRTELKWSIGTA